MNKTIETKKVPELRFPEFEDEWDSKEFKTLVEINQGLQIPINKRFTEKKKNTLFYITNEFLNPNSNKKYYVQNVNKSVTCDYADILMTRTGNTGHVVTNVKGAFHNNFFKIDYPDFIDRLFLYFFLTKSKTQNIISRLAGTSTIPDLNHSDFYKIKFNFPQLPEQQKIADFLSQVDKKINLLSQKEAALRQYKKGVMQKLFIQEIRFKIKNDAGELVEPPDWEEKRLGDLLDYQQPTKFIVDSTEYDDSYNTPVITAGKTFLLGYTNEDYNVYKDWPVIIFDDFTLANHYVEFDFKVKSSAMKILRTAKKSVDIKYIYERMQLINFQKGDEHKRFWISEYSKLKIDVPCIEEQTKIANFLSRIDEKIEVVAERSRSHRQWKKGLLQKLFV